MSFISSTEHSHGFASSMNLRFYTNLCSPCQLEYKLSLKQKGHRPNSCKYSVKTDWQNRIIFYSGLRLLDPKIKNDILML